MNEIMGSVKRVTDIIGEISSANSEQDQELGQINASVGELDRMTQQNAALVEESAAAAESLKEQARDMMDAISVFRSGAAPAAPRTGESPVAAHASNPLPTTTTTTTAHAPAPKQATKAPSRTQAPARPAPAASSPTGARAAPSRPAARPPERLSTGAGAEPVAQVPAVTAAPTTRAASRTSIRAAAPVADDDWETF